MSVEFHKPRTIMQNTSPELVQLMHDEYAKMIATASDPRSWGTVEGVDKATVKEAVTARLAEHEEYKRAANTPEGKLIWDLYRYTSGASLIAKMYAVGDEKGIRRLEVTSEITLDWFKLGRPYYKVWPSLLEKFNTIDFTKFPCEALRKTESPLSLRFPKNCPLLTFQVDGEEKQVRGVLARSFGHVGDISGGVIMIIDLGESDSVKQYQEPIFDDIIFSLDYETVHDALDALKDISYEGESAVVKSTIPTAVQLTLVRILVTVWMISEDSELLTPADPLEDLELTDGQRYAAKYASGKQLKKMGINAVDLVDGRHLGKEMETSPHWRNAHMYFQAHGPKYSLRRLRWRKGSVVKRKQLENVPTGYESEEEDGH